MWRIVIVLVLVGLCANIALALDGSGTQEDPWRIQSLADFDEFAADPNYWSGFTRLQTDVNLAGRTYTTAVIAPDTNNTPYSGFNGTDFTGAFDGNDHKLIGLTVEGNDYLGLFGFIEEGEVKNLGLEGGSVSGRSYVGGLMGHNSGTISNCYSTGEVNGTDNCVGGLSGANLGGYISKCHSAGDVNSYAAVGGLLGASLGGYISKCYSIGDVNGVECVGGLLGLNAGNIFNCYSTADVNGVVGVGGLVGENGSPGPFGSVFPGYIINTYSTGDVNGVDDVGGLVGYNYSGDIDRSFWDIQTSGQTESSGGTGKTTAQIKTISTFTDAGWDFVEVWGIGEHQTYPYLRFAPAGDINGDSIIDLKDLAILASHWLEEK